MRRSVPMVALVLPLLLARAAGAQSAARFELADVFRADSLNRVATTAYRERAWDRAAADWSAAAALPRAPHAGSLHYNAACAHALAGRTEAAFAALELALAAGFRDATLLGSDSDFASLREDPRWSGLVAAATAAAAAYARAHADPDGVHLETGDIARFWRAYDLARAGADSAARVAIFRREYVEHASPGYLDYFLSRIGSVERLEAFVTAQSAYYDGVRESTSRVAEMEPRIRAAFRRMREIHPASTFPDVYFGIGRLSSGGTVSQHGLLIGTEMYGVTPRTPTDGLPPFAQRIVAPIDQLPHIVAHELVHFEQSDGGPNTLLRAALVEGGADFIAALVLPGGAVPEYRRWGLENESRVWDRFQREMDAPDAGRWIGTAGQRFEDGWPGDLGYFVGHQIAQAYYERAADKHAAVADLLALRDPRAILDASGYAARFAHASLPARD